MGKRDHKIEVCSFTRMRAYITWGYHHDMTIHDEGLWYLSIYAAIYQVCLKALTTILVIIEPPACSC